MSLIGQKTLLEKDKMLVISVFSFSNNVFKGCLSHGRKKHEIMYQRVKSAPQGYTDTVSSEKPRKPVCETKCVYSYSIQDQSAAGIFGAYKSFIQKRGV